MIPPYERCQKLPSRSMRKFTGEHVVVEGDYSFDGRTWMGWCKFCGEPVYADSQEDYWHPLRPFFITEELEVEDIIR